MRNIITLLAAPLIAAFGLLTTTAYADTGFQWKHFGAAPYATSVEESMRTRAQAFACLGVTDPAAIAALVKATDQAGEKVKIVNGDHFDKMLSKGCVAHANVTVAFAAPVHNMEYAAPGERWQVTVGARTYILTRPDICNNWSLTIVDLPPPPLPPTPTALPPAEQGCLYIKVQVPYQDTLHRDLAARRPVPNSVCKGIKLEHGKGTIHHCDVCTFKSSVDDLHAKGYIVMIQPGNSYRFTCEVQEGCTIVERVPVTAGDRTDDDIYLFCLTYPNGGRSLVKDIHWRSYHDRVAYVGYTAPADWLASGGVLHQWVDPAGQQ